MKTESGSHGIIITTGTFTSDALDFAPGKSIMLINGVDLSLMIDVLTSSEQEELDELNSESESMEDEMPELEPLCPICSQKMIKRTARKGKNAGNTFWGCSQFPNCRGVISE
jgi:restriction system protein